MGSLNLELAQSRAKWDRAGEHLDVFKAEFPRLQSTSVCTFTATKIDPETGWTYILARPKPGSELRLPVILGDFVHNLRTCLDYIATALVTRSGATLASYHAFPIYRDPAVYRREVQSGHGVGKGKLHGVLPDLANLVEQLQPYHTQPNYYDNPLWTIQAFSNADKHRQLLLELSAPAGHCELTATFDATIVGSWKAGEQLSLPFNQDTRIAGFRFNDPFPTTVTIDSAITVETYFSAPKLNNNTPELRVASSLFSGLRDHVGMILNQFEAL